MPIPARGESRHGEDEKEDSCERHAGRAHHPHASATARSGTPPALVCRECGAPGRARPVLRLSGVLRAARGRPTTSRPSPASRSRPDPRNIWRYKALLPVPDRHRGLAQHRARLHPAAARPTTSAPSSGIDTALGQGRLHQPDQLLQGPRRRLRPERRPRARHAKVFACPSTGNLANAVAAAGARAGIRTVVFIPSDLEHAKQVNSAVYTDSLVAVERQLRRRQQARLRDRRRGGRLGVRQRQRPALLRRGLQDARLRDRRAARLAAARPGRHPGRLRLPADQGRQGVPGADPARAGRGQALQDLRRAGDRLLAGRRRPEGRRRRDPPGQARHDRQVAGDRQPGRRHLRARHLPAHRRRGRGRHRRGGPRGHPAAGPHRGDLHRDRRRHHRRRR